MYNVIRRLEISEASIICRPKQFLLGDWKTEVEELENMMEGVLEPVTILSLLQNMIVEVSCLLMVRGNREGAMEYYVATDGKTVELHMKYRHFLVRASFNFPTVG